jgi:hypothetical protein
MSVREAAPLASQGDASFQTLNSVDDGFDEEDDSSSLAPLGNLDSQFWRTRRVTAVLLSAVGAVFGVGAISWSVRPHLSAAAHGDLEAAESKQAEDRPTAAPYDCDNDVVEWKRNWSASKKQWCCDNFSKGCQPTSAPDPFTCDDGLETQWSGLKGDWCCKHYQKGCVAKKVKPDGFDCDSEYLRWADAWNSTKKDWCCKHEGKGCTAKNCGCIGGDGEGNTCTNKDDSETRSNWWCYVDSVQCLGAQRDKDVIPRRSDEWSEAIWSEEPCKNLFDCFKGADTWETSWSDSQKDWCCDNYERGCTFCKDYMKDVGCGWTDEYSCPGQPHSANFKWSAKDDGTAGRDSSKGWTCCCVEEGWKGKFKIHKDVPVAEPFNCDADAHNWKTGWSKAKKEWCCKNHGRGCKGDEPTAEKSRL